MRSSQRKAVVVLLHLPNRDLPSPDGVALRAIRTQLPPMNVGVAILATLSNIGENRPDVTLSAVHCLVQPAQRIFRLVVIEFRSATDWFPCAGCVAVLTRYAQVSVRTMRSSGNLRICAVRSCKKPKHQNRKQPENIPGPQHDRPFLNAPNIKERTVLGMNAHDAIHCPEWLSRASSIIFVDL